ncbi:MAG: hypothetical protein QM522_12170 [Chitinophagaceae bacterium]|nr:hypothetical protein [Chitinophagaceae bacterium]
MNRSADWLDQAHADLDLDLAAEMCHSEALGNEQLLTCRLAAVRRRWQRPAPAAAPSPSCGEA